MKRSELCVLLAMQGGLSPDELAEAGKEASRLEATVVAVKALKEHLQVTAPWHHWNSTCFIKAVPQSALW